MATPNPETLESAKQHGLKFIAMAMVLKPDLLANPEFRQRFQNVTGGGLPGLRQQQQQGTPAR